MDKYEGKYKDGKVYDKDKKIYRPLTPEEEQVRKDAIAKRIAGTKSKASNKSKEYKTDKKDEKLITTLSDVSPELMQQILATFKTEIHKGVIESLTRNPEKNVILNTNPISSTEVKKADLLDEPVYFYCPRINYIDYGYTLKGIEYLTPENRPIKFEKLPPDVTIDEKGKRHERHKCRVEVWSKTVLEYLRNSPYNGRIFFEGLEDLSHIDAKDTNVRQAVVAAVVALNSKQLANECMARGIAISNNDYEMQNNLINIMITEDRRRRLAVMNKLVETNQNDILLAEKAGMKPQR